MIYADYTFYTTEYGGTAIQEEQFSAFAAKASAYVDYATMNRAKAASGDALFAIKSAVCALSEVLADEAKLNALAYSSEQPVASETVGGWSRSYGSKSASTVDIQLLDSRKREAVSMYLAPYGLLQARGSLTCPCFPTL